MTISGQKKNGGAPAVTTEGGAGHAPPSNPVLFFGPRGKGPIAEAKRRRAARNAWRLLFRRDAHSVRRCKYWLRQYGVRDFTADQLRRPQAPFDLCCLATGADIDRWIDRGSTVPMTVHLGGGVLVKDTPERLEELGLLEDCP